ncbi:MAG TPA: triose-phosphate isomerase family protein [Lacunisphaera sp.]|nr:triose-phosphate isomerase family protein [Lacunisphaera sp.]
MVVTDEEGSSIGPSARAFGAIVLGVSLKMYLGYHETLAWCRAVAALGRRHPALTRGLASLFVLPSAPMLGEVRTLLAGTGIGFGAQDVFYEDAGAFTGAVSPRLLRELGCTHAEIGHAEQRRMFGETDAVVALKLTATLRNGLIPVLCVGESARGSPAQAAAHATRQVLAALRATDAPRIRLIVAYEPVWAIGANRPAERAHIRGVCTRLQNRLDKDSRLAGSRVIYGGSAGPGLLTALGGRPTGLFLGRFAHDPANLRLVLDEVLALGARQSERSDSSASG